MQIPVNKNIDDYKDDFFKGLTLKQTITSIVALVIGVIAFLFFYYYLKISDAIAFYLTLPIVFPIAAAGFWKIDGMTPIVWMKRRKELKEMPIYVFHPEMLQLLQDNGVERPKEEPKSRKMEKVYLSGGEEEEIWL